jgi:hypothetical protein
MNKKEFQALVVFVCLSGLLIGGTIILINLFFT